MNPKTILPQLSATKLQAFQNRAKLHLPFMGVVFTLMLTIFIFYFLGAVLETSPYKLARYGPILFGEKFQTYFYWGPEGNFLLWFMGENSASLGLQILLILLFGFIATYLSKEPKQRPIQILISIALLITIYGFQASGAFIAAHYFIYYIFHCTIRGRYFSNKMKMWTSQAPLLVMLGLALFNWRADHPVGLPLGLILLCWQWIRLTIYFMDEQDGLIPPRRTFIDYLAVLAGPGSTMVIPDTFYIGLGYHYVMDNYSFQKRNETICAGLKLFLIALGYVLLGPFIYRYSTYALISSGVPVAPTVEILVQRHVAGENLTSLTILLSCLLGQLHWFFLYAGASHARIAIWRFFGYNLPTHFNKPWLATNLVSLWERHTVYFRLALLRVSFFPLFFKFRKLNLVSRLSVATFGSAGITNMFWAHVPMFLLLSGFTIASLGKLPTWPYYFMLSMGILLTEIYLLKRRKKRQAWTFDKWIVGDILCASLTLTYFCLIHVFARPVDGGTIKDYAILFLKGCGIYL